MNPVNLVPALGKSPHDEEKDVMDTLGSLGDLGFGGSLVEGSLAAFGLIWFASNALTGNWL